MRQWEGISATHGQLARGEPLRGAATIDMKADVVPNQSVGEEQLGAFKDSVHEHVARVRGLAKLRGTASLSFQPGLMRQYFCCAQADEIYNLN
jgi:hypothetical protein